MPPWDDNPAAAVAELAALIRRQAAAEPPRPELIAAWPAVTAALARADEHAPVAAPPAVPPRGLARRLARLLTRCVLFLARTPARRQQAFNQAALELLRELSDGLRRQEQLHQAHVTATRLRLDELASVVGRLQADRLAANRLRHADAAQPTDQCPPCAS